MNWYLVKNQSHFLSLESMPHIKVSSTSKDYYELLNKRLKIFTQITPLDIKSKRLAMINKDRTFFPK